MRREGRPLSVGEIVWFLGQDGWVWTSFDPNDSVKTSLKKAPDLVTVAHNRWIIENHQYEQAEIVGALPKMVPGDKKYRWHLIKPEVVKAGRDKVQRAYLDKRARLRAEFNSR